MFGPRPSVLDQDHAARAAGALLVGELDEAHEHLSEASSRYLAGFFLRLALVTRHFSLGARSKRPHVDLSRTTRQGARRRSGRQWLQASVKVSLKAGNLLKLFLVWVVNVAVFSGIATGSLDVSDIDALRALISMVASDPGAGWPYVGLLTAVSLFNGSVRRTVKERLVFWPDPRPASRAFSHFLFKDSTINRTALEEHFGPLPTDPDEQNSLWASWLHEFENDHRVRDRYGQYLFARDWMTVAAATLILAAPLALWLADDAMQALFYAVLLLAQCAIARRVARVQGEQLVMSVMSCKGSSPHVGSRDG